MALEFSLPSIVPKQKEIVISVAKVFLSKTPRRTTATSVFLDHTNGVAIVVVHVRSSRERSWIFGWN
jgi:hypothetical protein